MSECLGCGCVATIFVHRFVLILTPNDRILDSGYFNDLLSLLNNFRSRSTAGYLHMSVPSTQSGCAYVLSVAQHLSILEERLHHSVFIYTPFRRKNGEDCFVSNGEWVYTVIVGLLGPTTEVLRGTKAVYNAWRVGGEEKVK